MTFFPEEGLFLQSSSISVSPGVISFHHFTRINGVVEVYLGVVVHLYLVLSIKQIPEKVITA